MEAPKSLQTVFHHFILTEIKRFMRNASIEPHDREVLLAIETSARACLDFGYRMGVETASKLNEKPSAEEPI